MPELLVNLFSSIFPDGFNCPEGVEATSTGGVGFVGGDDAVSDDNVCRVRLLDADICSRCVIIQKKADNLGWQAGLLPERMVNRIRRRGSAGGWPLLNFQLLYRNENFLKEFM